MKIRFHKKFVKQYSKLSIRQKDKVDGTIDLFEANPFVAQLNNHALKGKMSGRGAICAGGDLRLIFKEYDKYALVLFLEVGSHNQVY